MSTLSPTLQKRTEECLLITKSEAMILFIITQQLKERRGRDTKGSTPVSDLDTSLAEMQRDSACERGDATVRLSLRSVKSHRILPRVALLDFLLKD